MGDSKKLSAKILIGMAVGIVVGVVLNSFIDNPIVKNYIVGMIFNFGSSVFTNAIQMLVVPLVLFSLVVGTCDMGDVTKWAVLVLKPWRCILAVPLWQSLFLLPSAPSFSPV